MAGNYTTQRIGKRLQAGLVGKHETRLHHVRVAVGGTGVVEQHALLQRCQWVDVLHVSRAAGDASDDAVKGALVQVDQVEVLRRNARAARADEVGRHVHRALFHGHVLAALDHRHQRWLVFTQLRHQRGVGQGLTVALDGQLAVLQRQLHVFGRQCCQ
ncbi:hypothetical protein PAGU2196_13770 [Pseudomonas sp. PAGU 2196]|nr:hypothetical protein PAGU2196_13770 [Pseudomonas sp. PAGU 2196]